MSDSMQQLPAHLCITRDELGQGQPVKLEVVTDANAMAERMAADMLAAIRDAIDAEEPAIFIVPVGPVDQYPILADFINQQRLDCRDVVFINMDEYLDENGHWLDADHPLSFRGYMNRRFYDLLDPKLAPRSENRVLPDPQDPSAIQRLIRGRGGVKVTFGGIGINGHIAFNEPPEPGESLDNDVFAELPTRKLELSRETRTINANTVGGGIEVIPRHAMTVGMKEILSSERIHLYCNRPWQSAVIRRVLHAPITAACPCSLIRRHHDARFTVTEEVAQPPDIRLR